MAFVYLNPVPEPATLPVCLLGGLLVFPRQRRTKP